MNPVQAPSEEEEVETLPENGDDEEPEAKRYSITEEQLEALAELPLASDRRKLVNKIYRTQSPLVPVKQMRDAFHKVYVKTQNELERELLRLSKEPEIRPGDISTYPTGPWPEGTLERVKEELGRLSQEAK